MDKNQLKHIIKEEYHNVKSFMEDKYGFTPELGKVISNPYAKSFVNEISAEGGLKRVIKGQTREVEGIKLSVPMAQAMLDWFNSSPYGRKYPKAKKAKLNLSLGIMMGFGLDRYAKHKGAKDELKYINTLAKAMRESTINHLKSLKEEKVYIDFLNKKKGFKQDRIHFDNYKKAVKWARKNLEKFHPDMIHYESVNEGKVDSILKRIKSAYDKSKNKKLDIKKLKDQLKTYKKLGASDKKDQIKAGEMFLKSIGESLNEAFLVAYGKREGNKSIKPAFAAYADKKMAQKFMADMKKDGYKVMMTQKKIKGIDEGKKRYNVMHGVGKSKYVVNYHDGKKKHNDGSDFFDISTFNNKKDLAKKINDLHKGGYKYGFAKEIKEGVFSNLDLIRQNSKDARDFIKNVFKDDDFKDMKNDREFLKYLKSIYEGFASDAQRRAAFASGYKAKGKKGKKKESIEEYDVENYQDVKEFVEFMKEYKSDVNEAEYQGRDVKLNKIMQGDVKKFKVYVKNPKGNVVKVNFGHKGKGGEKTMRIKKSDPERRKSFRARHNCDNPGPRHKARYWACRTW